MDYNCSKTGRAVPSRILNWLKMKATLENLKKALRACANAHKARYFDWKEDEQFAIKSETVPIIADIRTILQAFFGKTTMLEVEFGYSNVYLDDCTFGGNVDEEMLKFALPAGAKL